MDNYTGLHKFLSVHLTMHFRLGFREWDTLTAILHTAWDTMYPMQYKMVQLTPPLKEPESHLGPEEQNKPTPEQAL